MTVMSVARATGATAVPRGRGAQRRDREPVSGASDARRSGARRASRSTSPPRASGCSCRRRLRASSSCRPGTATSSCWPTAGGRSSVRSRLCGRPTRRSSTSRSCCTTRASRRSGPPMPDPAIPRRVSGPGRGYVDRSRGGCVRARGRRERDPGDHAAARIACRRRAPCPCSSRRGTTRDVRCPTTRGRRSSGATRCSTRSATSEITDDTRVWAAGEAAAMQRIRRHLFEERGVRAPAGDDPRLLEARPRRRRGGRLARLHADEELHLEVEAHSRVGHSELFRGLACRRGERFLPHLLLSRDRPDRSRRSLAR